MELLLAGFAIGSSFIMVAENIRHKYIRIDTWFWACFPLVVATCLIIKHFSN